MKIAHITFKYKPITGGLEVYLGNLYSLLAEHGHSQKVFQMDSGIKSQELRLIKRNKYLPGHVDYFMKLYGLKKELSSYDLLIIHFSEFYYPLRWHKNTLVLSHGATWTAENNKFKKWLRKKANDFAVSNSNKYVFNDTFTPRSLGINCQTGKKLFKEIEKKKWFIPNCVNGEIFSKTDGIKELKKLNPILVPRNLTYQRGIDLAIKAFAIFNKKFPKTNLVIIGDIHGNKYIKFKKELEKIVNELNLNKKVIFWGSVASEKMINIYSSGLMTLIPTRASEGTSLSALESMACGIATISTNVEGLNDLPTIKAKANYKDLAKKMINVFPKRRRISSEQRKIVKEVYNIENWKSAWLKAIK